MMRKMNKICTLLIGILLLGSNQSPIHAQSEERPFKGYFYEKDEKIALYLDLYETTLTVPGMSFLGKVNGYMQGNIYGVWMLTKFTTKKKKATLRFSNDLGADSQTIQLTFLNDSTIKYEAIDGNHIKRAHKRKLIKIPEELYFTKVKDSTHR